MEIKIVNEKTWLESGRVSAEGALDNACDYEIRNENTVLALGRPRISNTYGIQTTTPGMTSDEINKQLKIARIYYEEVVKDLEGTNTFKDKKGNTIHVTGKISDIWVSLYDASVILNDAPVTLACNISCLWCIIREQKANQYKEKFMYSHEEKVAKAIEEKYEEKKEEYRQKNSKTAENDEKIAQRLKEEGLE